MKLAQPCLRIGLTLLVVVAVAAPALADEYAVADASAELAISIDPGESMVWLDTFPADAAGPFVDTLRVAYGRVGGPSSLDGLPVVILLYEDVNGGSPGDAVLRWSTSATIANGNTNVLNVYHLPATRIEGSLVVGALYANATAVSKAIGSLDTTAPSLGGRSWVGFAASIDPTDLGAIPPGQWGTIEGFGTIGNFRIEAHGRVVDDAAVTLKAVKSVASGLVALTWSGGAPTVDVARAARPDFSDGEVVALGTALSAYDDPTLTDGRTWLYRVR